MSGALQLHIVRRGDALTGKPPFNWRDPENLAPLAPEKIQTLRDFPLPVAENEPVQIVGTQDQEAIGRIDLLPGLLEVGGETVRIYWGSEFSVPAAHRKSLMGVMLLMKSHGLHHTLGALGPSQMALPVYTKLGWADLPIPRYVMIRRSRTVVERYLGRGVPSAILAPAADAMLALHRAIAAIYRLLRTSGLSAEPADAMPPQFDAALSQRRAPISTHRSAAWINWQLTHSFRTEPRYKKTLYLVKNRRGETVGYFLNKVRFLETATHRGFKNVLLGAPLDWMVFDPTSLSERDLLLLSLARLYESNVDAIELCTHDPALTVMLRPLGFLRVGNMHLVVRAKSPSPLAAMAFQDLRQWWIRPGDGDNAFF